MSDITVGFSPSEYVFNETIGAVSLMLVVSGLDPGVLECPVDVTIEYTDGSGASKHVVGSLSECLVHLLSVSTNLLSREF